MSIQDARWLFSDAQTFGTNTAIASTNIVDTGVGADFFGTAVAADPGASGDLWLNVFVDTAFTSGSVGLTLTAALQDSPSTTAASFATVGTGVAKAKALLVAGYNLWQSPFPTGLQRYVRVLYTLAGSVGVPTAGKINAWAGYKEGFSR